jgi:TonB family protein
MIHSMKKFLGFLSIALLAPTLIEPALAQEAVHAMPPQTSNMKLGLELLTDTNGKNIAPYIRELSSGLKKHWLALGTEAENQPLLKQEETVIDLTIAADGHLSAMRLANSTQNAALDKAAWNTAKEMTYLPPPPGMKDSNLKMRVHFVVN